jgi:transcriptional regulator with XRE-family HTH domain
MTWWITDTSIGQRLKFIRRFRRLTQKELGLLMGYSEKTADVRIAQYEKNARTPNAETTAKLAEVLKVSPAVFSRRSVLLVKICCSQCIGCFL